MKRRLALVLILAGLLPALACNLPTAAAPTRDVERAVVQTLEALHATDIARAVVSFPTIAPVSATLAPQPAVPVEELPTFTPLPPLPIVTVNAPTPPPTLDPHTFQYVTQPGDTLAALALRFGVPEDQILDPQEYPAQQMLRAGQMIVIPNSLVSSPEPEELLPDSEIVYSPAALDFSIRDFVQRSGGFLNSYTEAEDDAVLTGAQIIQRVAEETSINPRLLLAVLEYRAHWVSGSSPDPNNLQYPIGFYANGYSGLYKELILVARQLTIGYYGWRTGQVTDVEFAGGSQVRIHPVVNAGTAALQYLFAKLYSPAEWQEQLYGPGRFIQFYAAAFGDPWQRAAAMGPLLPDGLAQPELELPFLPGQTWTLTGGPHAAWGIGSAWGGLDFAPSAVERGCTVSRFWATAAAPGLVVRSEDGEVLEDLDGDGHEQTGWVLLYLHVAEQERVAVGAHLKTNDLVGHPSCEGGFATGTHVHIARKYNGEWLAADGPLPFVLTGWQAAAGDRQYSGELIKAGQVVTSRIDSVSTSIITR